MRTAVAAALLASLALAAGAAGAPRDSYCSPSGDYCTSSKREAGTIKLSLRTFSFSGRYRLCVRGSTGGRVCRSFPLRRRGGLWRSDVPWYRHFPNRGTGIYRVTWHYAGTQLGPQLSFVLAQS